jgi:hypothetical protein
MEEQDGPKPKMGRPKKKLNFELVEKLAAIMCTQEEIAGILNVSLSTLKRNEDFCTIYKKAQDGAKMSIRRSQFKKALAGDTTMLIWLGKIYLGQRETVNQEVSLAPVLNISNDQTPLFDPDILKPKTQKEEE